MTSPTRTSATAAAGDPAPSPAGGIADELLGLLAGLRRVTRRRLRGALPDSRPQGTQLELLRLVEGEPGIGVAAAARELRLAGNSVSTLVNQLVRDGFLSREVDPNDRRAARLLLTERARERMAGWRRVRGQLVGAALDRLPDADRAAVEAALPALRRLLRELEEDG